jgi:DNA-binding transcriptional regulator YiaG
MWTPTRIRQLRMHLGFSQAKLADTIQVRQATISEWECGMYAPRRMMRLVLTILADDAGFPLGDKPNG